MLRRNDGDPGGAPPVPGRNEPSTTRPADGLRGSVRFRPGEIILREDDHADRVYLIETGKVILESGRGHGKPVVVDTIGAGDLLGWSWMFPPYAWQFTARAVEATRAIFFAGPVLREYCERDPSLGYELLKRLTAVMNRRVQNARRRMLDVHSGKISLEPVVSQSPFMGQESATRKQPGWAE